MSEKVVPFRRKEPAPGPTRPELVSKMRELIKDSTNIRYNHDHIKMRFNQRNIIMRHVLDTLRYGRVISGPTLDKYGDWRIKLTRRVAGRRVQVVVAIKEDHVVIVTAI
ncbi:MAG TPA: DUF4258 domain-containing protein [Alphaproteobacteria bacterium]